MARIPTDELERLKKETDLVELVRSSGVELKAHGKDLLGLCPFHDDHEPSLVVTASKNLWNCLGACGEGGTVVDWVMRTQGVSFRHAVEILRGGGTLSAPVAAKRSTVRRLPCPLTDDTEGATLIGQVVDYYHEVLLESPEAKAYLERRGIWDPEVVEIFKLGFANRTLGLRLPEKNRAAGARMRKRLVATGLFRASGHEHFNGSLVIPVHDATGKVVEVYDLVSSLVLYDREVNETLTITGQDTTTYLYTFPSWSPDGDYLYFSRAPQVIDESSPQLEQIENTHYDIARKPFDPESRAFGETEVVFQASALDKSASFPRISPDGRFMVMTVADYGTFPIWHREADLYLLDLDTGESRAMEINSDETESYHAWSSNGKWLVFSSRRSDGRTTRPYFAHVGPDGRQGKEFVLPQEDPSLYDRMLESFNIPELVTGRVELDSRDFVGASRQETLKAKPGNPGGIPPAPSEPNRDPREHEGGGDEG